MELSSADEPRCPGTTRLPVQHGYHGDGVRLSYLPMEGDRATRTADQCDTGRLRGGGSADTKWFSLSGKEIKAAQCFT